MMTQPKLTDLQLVLLAVASQRANGSLLPPPESIGAQSARIRKAATTLITRGFAVETETGDPTAAWRTAEGKHYGVVITDTGRAVVAAAEARPGGPPVVAAANTAAPADEPVRSVSGEGLMPAGTMGNGPSAPRPTKTAGVIDLLRRDGGATLPQLVEATGWLPHTTRAALTGLRKKGHAIARGSYDGVTVYSLARIA